MVKQDWRELLTGFSEGYGAVPAGSLAKYQKAAAGATAQQNANLKLQGQLQRWDIQNRKDIQAMRGVEKDYREEQVQDQLFNTFVSQDEQGGYVMDSAGLLKALEEADREDLYAPVMQRYKDTIAADTAAAKAESKQRAQIAEDYLNIREIDGQRGLAEFQKLVPNATSIMAGGDADGNPGTWYHTPEGMGFMLDNEMQNMALDVEKQADLDAAKREHAAEMANPSTEWRTYEAERKKYRDQGMPWPYGSFTEWSRADRLASAGVEAFGTKQALKSELEVWKEEQKIFMKGAGAKQMMVAQLQGLDDAGLLHTGPGEELALDLLEMAAAAERLTGEKFGVDYTKLGAQQLARQIMMKLAYMNREEFMPGQLSNMENIKLTQMEISLSTADWARKYMMEGILMDTAFKKKRLAMKKKVIEDTNGSMKFTRPRKVRGYERWKDGEVGVPGRGYHTVTATNWDEYENAMLSVHLKKRNDVLEKAVADQKARSLKDTDDNPFNIRRPNVREKAPE